jgi:hypothetical protein
VELRPCWQALARRVNDTSGHASGAGGYVLVPRVSGVAEGREIGEAVRSAHKIQSRQKLDGEAGRYRPRAALDRERGGDPERFSGE